jgi:hypothetical protein
MSKALLSILIALLFVAGVSGIAIAEAKQGQTGSALHSAEKAQIRLEQMEKIRQSPAATDEHMVFQRHQYAAGWDSCSQTGMKSCDSDHGTKIGRSAKHHDQNHSATERHHHQTTHDTHHSHNDHE